MISSQISDGLDQAARGSPAETIGVALSTVAAFAAIADDLGKVKACSAETFQELAKTLQSVSGCASEIAARSREITELLAGAGSEKAVDAINRTLDETRRFQGLSAPSREKLQKILGCLENARSPLSRQKHLPTVLATIRTLGSVEGSRLQGAALERCSLSEDIGALAVDIDRHVSTLADYATQLIETLTHDACVLKTVAAEQDQGAADLIARSHAVLESLQARQQASSAAAGTIDGQYAAVCAEIGEIVMSIQAEDIARQRIEHVQEALRRAAASLENGNTKECAEIVILQRLQVTRTREFLSESIASIANNLRSLQQRVKELADGTQHLSSQTNSDGQLFDKAIAEGLATVSSISGRYLSCGRSLLSVLQTIVPAVANMTKSAKGLERIEAKIRRTALNARIETHQLGPDGAPLRVLAAEVQSIAENSQEDTAAIKDCLTAMDREVATLSSDSDQWSSIMGAFCGDKLKRTIDSLTASAAASRENVLHKLTALLESVGVLQDQIQTAGERAQSNQVASQMEEILQRLELALEPLGGEPEAMGEASSNDMDHLSSLYCMQSERDAHRQIFAGGEDAASDLGGDIELF